jgi:protoheme IX farnesyltransferase
MLRDFLSLTKPRLSSLVILTTAGGMWLSNTSVEWTTWLWTLLGTAGTVASANALNCVIEKDSDRFMRRTSARPLPAGRMRPEAAMIFAVLLGAVSVPVLIFGVNLLTGLLGLASLLTYSLVYTPLKATSHLAMLVGAVPGAMPPLMGWTAATNRIDSSAIIVFAILFFWQLPHFLAIALFRKSEYSAAGLKSVPIVKGDEVARRHALGYIAILVPISLLPSAVNLAGTVYFVTAVALGALFVAVGARGFLTRGDDRWARQLFFTSLIYLTGLFGALGLDRTFSG